jgi:hypothetical protein
MNNKQLLCLQFIEKYGTTTEKIKQRYYKKYNIKNYLSTLYQLKMDGFIDIEFSPGSDGNMNLQEPYYEPPWLLRHHGIELKEKLENKTTEKFKISMIILMNILLVACAVLQTIKLFI